MAKLRGTSFDDNLVREFVIKFCKQKWNINLKSNDELYKIDLLGIDDPELGVEVEHGKWEGNFWENEIYSLISNQGFRTINIPARKEKYWLNPSTFRGKTTDNPSATKNIFIRTNKDFSQIIVIKPEVVKDSKKLVRTSFQPGNSNEVENWLSFRREHVETYNLVNGEYVLDVVKTDNVFKKLWHTITHLLK